MIHRLYQIIIVLVSVFALYLVVVRGIITWAQYFPKSLISFTEEITDSSISIGILNIEQSWLGLSVEAKKITVDNKSISLEIGELVFDFNILSPLLPNLKSGEEFNLTDSTFNFKSEVKTNTNIEIEPKQLMDNLAIKSWQSIKLENVNLHSYLKKGVELKIKVFHSYFGSSWAFAGLIDLRVKGKEESEFQYEGTFKTGLWHSVESGTAYFSVIKPINLEDFYEFLPKKLAQKLPSGMLVGDADFEISNGILSNLKIAANLQKLVWKGKDEDLAQSMGINLKLVDTPEDNSWLFEFEEISLDNDFIQTISPVFLHFTNSQQLRVSAEKVDIFAIKPIFKSLIKIIGYQGLGSNIKELSFVNLKSEFDLKEGRLNSLSFSIPSLDLPQHKLVPGIKFNNLYFSKKDTKISVDVQEGLEFYIDYISPNPIQVIATSPYKLSLDNSKKQWHMQETILQIDKIPVQINASGNFSNKVDLRLDIEPKTLAKVKQYLPYSLMTKDLENWLKDALVNADNVKGFLEVKGDLANFPFSDGKGKLYAEATADNIGLKFQPDWPSVQAFTGKMVFTPYDLTITSDKVKLKEVFAEDLEVKIWNLDSDDIAVNISGVAKSSATKALDFLQESPLLKWVNIDKFIANNTTIATGDIQVNLDKIWVPVLGFDNRSVEVVGNVVIDRVNLSLFDELHFNELEGKLLFTEKSIDSSEDVSGKFGRGSASYNLITKDGTINIHGAGVANMDNYYLSGSQEWQALVKIPLEGNAPISIETDISLDKAISKLPEPLNNFKKLTSAKLEARLNILKNNNELELKLSDQYLADINFSGDFKKLLGFNFVSSLTQAKKNKLKNKQAYQINGKLEKLSLDNWLSFISKSTGKSYISYDEERWRPSNLFVKNLRALGQEFKNVNLNIYQVNLGKKTDTILSINSKKISLLASRDGNNHYILNLDKLDLERFNEVKQSKSSCKTVNVDFTLPSLDFIGKNIKIGSKNIPKLNFNIRDNGDNIFADSVVINLGNKKGTIRGGYTYTRKTHSSHVIGEIKSSNIEEILSFLEVKKGLVGEKLNLSADLEWPGFVNCFSKIKLSGKLKYELEEGIIKDAEPGVARILGLLSLESLARRLSLDVSDVTDAGLSFDSITGYGRFNKGVFGVEKLTLKAPAADASIFGEINLVQEDMELYAEITPAIGASLPVIAAISGFATPIAGLAAYALLKVVPGINEDLITYKYEISGKFDKPVIKDKGLSVNIINLPVHEDKTEIIDLE